MIYSLSLSVARATHLDEYFTLPDTVLTGETPHLRRLELHRININWNIATSARPTTDQLMNALERMPALEVLNIQDALCTTIPLWTLP